MRSIPLLAATTVIVLGGWACGDGGDVGPNNEPTASFTLPACTANVPCTFTDASTDNGTITTWNWTFGDGASAQMEDPTHTYGTAGDFTVTLIVTDNEGNTDAHSATVTVTAGSPTNVPPTAGFTYLCDGVACTFTNSSIDTDGIISATNWTFGDNTTSAEPNPTHSYNVTTATPFTVTLTVTDDDGATDVETQTVTVSPGVNTPPTAGFTYTCNAAVCTFTSTSTDVAPGTIATYAWTFGDGGTADVINPLHSYAITAPSDFTVTLTVTDNEGATDVETQTVSVSPPPAGAEGCTTSDGHVDCALDIAARSTVKLKLLAINCDLQKQRVIVPSPINDQVFLNVCSRTVGEELGIFGGPLDEAIVFEAGTQVRIRFVQGIVDANHPILDPPAGRLEGTFPNWTISFEDGANPGGAGEPDFADVVVGVVAIPAP